VHILIVEKKDNNNMKFEDLCVPPDLLKAVEKLDLPSRPQYRSDASL